MGKIYEETKKERKKERQEELFPNKERLRK